MNTALKTLIRSTVFAAATFISAEAFAQAQPQDAQRGIASPGRVQEQIEQPAFKPTVMPRIEVKELKLQAPPEGAEKIAFTLKRIDFEGMTAYTQEEIRKTYASKIGQDISLAELYGIAADITRRYRNDGYILTQVAVPPQTIEDGVARLQVVEGYIDRIQVRGQEGTSLEVIRNYAAMISQDGVLNTKNLERGLLTINDLPGVSARGVLSPSATKTGAADLLIIVEKDMYDGFISLDNYGTRFLGPVQGSVFGARNSVFGYHDRLAGQFVAAAGNHEFFELAYGSLNYTLPVGRYGTKFDFFTSVNRTDPGFTLDQFDVNGKSQNFAFTVSHPFIRTRTFNLSGRAMFDYIDVDTSDNLGATPPREDRIRAVRVGGTLEFLDRVFGLGFNTVDVLFSQGLEVMGSNSKGDPDVTRPTFDPDFLKMELEAQRLQRITSDINLLLGVKGQWSSNPLLSSEEFGVGGISYGRGYDPSEIIGEDGIAGKIEVQWDAPYNLSLLEDYQLYGFYDAGRVWNEDPAGDLTIKKETVTSTGIGMRASFNENTSLNMLLALPLNNTPQTQDDRDPRFFMKVSHSF